jgi:hypothetical protein
MPETRTNQTLHIRELLNQAITPLQMFSDCSLRNAPISSIQQQDEAGGPVRPAVRVSLSASHYFSRHGSLLHNGSSSSVVDSNEREWATAS